MLSTCINKMNKLISGWKYFWL